MCIVLLPPGVNIFAVNKYIKYKISNNRGYRYKAVAFQRPVSMVTIELRRYKPLI